VDPTLQNALIFAAAGIAGMFGHYWKAWYRKEIAGNLLDYLFRDNPRATAASFSGVIAAAATAWFTGTLDDLTLKPLLMAGFTAGFTLDSTLNKSTTAVQAAPQGDMAPKQDGFVRLGLLLGMATAGLLLLGLANCASTPNVQSAAYDAQLTADAAVKQIPILLGNGAITPATATKIRNAAVIVYGAAGALQGCTAACSTADLDAALAALAALIPQK
jgi:hypothetical protein